MGIWIPYSAKELAWIEAHCTWPRRKAHAKFCAKFGRTDVSPDNFKQLCLRTGCFPAGHVPDNKGKKMPYNAAIAATQFKKGQLPPNTKFLGHEYVSSKDGYTYISIDEKNPHTGFERRHVLKHKYLWEKKHGKVPEKMCLKSIDGNRLNTDPSNWELIPRALLVALNHRTRPVDYDTAPAAVKPAIMTLAKLRGAKAKVKGKKSLKGVV